MKSLIRFPVIICVSFALFNVANDTVIVIREEFMLFPAAYGDAGKITAMEFEVSDGSIVTMGCEKSVSRETFEDF